MARWRARKARSEDGASAVEFALVLIPLTLILFGIINYSYMFTQRQALTQSAAEGARAAAVAPPGSDPVAAATSAINEAMAGFGLVCSPDGELTCKPIPCESDNETGCVTIQVTLKESAYRLIDLPLTPMPDNLTFTSSAEIN